MSSICSLNWVKPFSSLAKDNNSQVNETKLPSAALSSSTPSARPIPRPGRVITSADLYGGNGKTAPLNPRSSDVLQRSFGDCYVLASLMSLADQNPAQIRRAISYNDNTHNFAVTLHHERSGLFGTNRHTTKSVIKVTQQDLADNIARGGGGMNANLSSPAWVTVMETAFAKSLDHNWSNGLDEGYRNLAGGNISMFTITGRLEKVLQLPERTLPSFMPSSQTRNIAKRIYTLFANKLRHHAVITAWTRIKKDGLRNDHTYEVVGVSKNNSSGKRQITLRDPHQDSFDVDGKRGSPNSDVTIPLETLLEKGSIRSFHVDS